MNPELLQPSLNETPHSSAKVHDMSRLFYVAFFGGTVPFAVLGARTMTALGVEKWKIRLFVALCAVVLAGKLAAIPFSTGQDAQLSAQMVRLAYRAGCVLVYLLMMRFGKSAWTQFRLFGGQTAPLLKPALIWIGIGIVIELVLVLTTIWFAQDMLHMNLLPAPTPVNGVLRIGG